MPEVSVADLSKATAAFCSSTIHESRSADHGVIAASQEMSGQNEVVLGKRNAVQSFGEIARNVKNLKSGSRSLQILHDSNDLVGRLLLCNKKRHSWGGLSAAADCLAFTDSTASVCCSVSQGLDVSFVGKLVRVNSWSFVPFTGPHSGHGSTKSRRGAAESTEEAHKVSSNSPRSRERNCIRAAMNIEEERSSADGSGFLEIHSMELLEEESLDLPTFPSLCVDPAAADIDSSLFESPLIKQKEKGSRLTICGKLQCISPQFSLPCDYTDGRDNSMASNQSMIGFLMELVYCPSCSSHYIDVWSMGNKKENQKSRRLFADEHSSTADNGKNGVDTDGNDN
ncbi:hypothetical protein R1flu_006792 [Riccia fluitans]|uniref:CST complex subunit CTC1 n=1 Tax=Riccia fluitans TaxID=41844 RepID=A0ABD1YX06_9MARC